MVNNVIVSLKIEGLDELMDVELPCQVHLSEVLPHLLSGLKELGIPSLQRAKTLSLVRGNTALSTGKSLAESGVWDGSIVSLNAEE